MNDVEEEKRVESLKNKKKWGVPFFFKMLFIFLVEICKKCEGKEETFYFTWKKVSQHLRNCPHNAEKKGNVCFTEIILFL